MSRFETEGPFSSEQIDEVPLAHAPLVRVLAQLRFPGAISTLKYGSSAIERLAAPLTNIGYPLLEEEQQVTLQITADGVTQVPAGRLWSFRSGDQAWQINLSPEFITLHTSAYGGRDDFVARLESLLEVVSGVMAPPGVNRIGFRYINQIAPATPEDIASLIRPQLLGGLAVPQGSARLAASLSEAMFSFDAGSTAAPGAIGDGLQARWGLLAGGVTLEPSLRPADVPSWVLDLDSFRHSNEAFESAALARGVHTLSMRAYRFFRWAVTEAFLERFGATK